MCGIGWKPISLIFAETARVWSLPLFGEQVTDTRAPGWIYISCSSSDLNGNTSNVAFTSNERYDSDAVMTLISFGQLTGTERCNKSRDDSLVAVGKNRLAASDVVDEFGVDGVIELGGLIGGQTLFPDAVGALGSVEAALFGPLLVAGVVGSL
jgi:hypothetical protein